MMKDEESFVNVSFNNEPPLTIVTSSPTENCERNLHIPGISPVAEAESGSRVIHTPGDTNASFANSLSPSCPDHRTPEMLENADSMTEGSFDSSNLSGPWVESPEVARREPALHHEESFHHQQQLHKSRGHIRPRLQEWNSLSFSSQRLKPEKRKRWTSSEKPGASFGITGLTLETAGSSRPGTATGLKTNAPMMTPSSDQQIVGSPGTLRFLHFIVYVVQCLASSLER